MIVLVHGAWHGASCWEPVVRALDGLGHEAVAVELPSDRPGLGADAYADAVLAAVSAASVGPSADGRLVLVGHSLGGLTVPVVAQRLGPERVAAIVLVAALVPVPGTGFDERARAEPGIMARGFGRGQQRHDDGTTSWPPAEGASGLYRGVAEESSEAIVASAVAELRPQAWTITQEVTPLTAWPAVPTTVVVCAEDRVVDADRLRREALAIPGAALVELPGGHFPMLTRPTELAAVLHEAARGS